MLKIRKTTTTLALLSGISMVGGALLPAPAHAYTLMDMLRGRDRQQNQSLPGVVTEMPSERAIRDPEPLPKVAPPKYMTYRADSMRTVRTTGFAAASATDQTRLLSEARVSAPADIAAALEAYYGKNAAPVWVENGDLNEKAHAVLGVLRKAADYGFDPADYALDEPQLTTSSVTPDAPAVPAAATEGTVAPAPADAAVTDTTAAPASAESPAIDAAVQDAQPAVANSGADKHDKELMQFDVALSAKVLMFAQDMVRGRLDPNRISEYHDFKRKSVQLDTVLGLTTAAPDAAAYLDSLAPNNAEFTALKAELARVRGEAQTENAIRLPDDLLLKPGMSSPDMENVIAAIEKKASEAFKTRQAATIAAYQKTPEYSPELVAFVKDFQKETGLNADGVIGRGTVKAITGDTGEDKAAKLVVAMEQARWLPANLGDRYVMINQPSFRVYYHEHGKEQFSMRTVIGSKAHQTFFFQDEIQTVEFNPYWGVPQSIIVNEMLPKLRNDPNYLDRMGYEVAVNGKAVPSSSVNWYGSTQSISVRQPPSSDNALGDLKILFPNAHAIYMHDTPSKSFFNRDMRALSHGCVRLQEPRKMAAAVLGISEQDVDARIAGGKNVAAPVNAKIPVYIAYFTAWPNKDGKVEYFGDVYDRDTATLKALDATSKARNLQA